MASFDVWLACQRMYNVTPSVVETSAVGPLKVRFLAQVASCDESPQDLYDEGNVLACGFEDEDETIELVVVKDTYQEQPCLVLLRSASSYFDGDESQALEVQVYDPSVGAAHLIEQLRQACTPDSFEDLSDTAQVGEFESGAHPLSGSTSRTGQSPASRNSVRPFSALRDNRPWWQRLFS